MIRNCQVLPGLNIVPLLKCDVTVSILQKTNTIITTAITPGMTITYSLDLAITTARPNRMNMILQNRMTMTLLTMLTLTLTTSSLTSTS